MLVLFWWLLLFGFLFCICFHAPYVWWHWHFMFSSLEIENLLKEQDRRIKKCRKNEDNIHALLSWILQHERWDFGDAISLRGRSIGVRVEWGSSYPPPQPLLELLPLHSTPPSTELARMLWSPLFSNFTIVLPKTRGRHKLHVLLFLKLRRR